jgi:hypothetical protein
MNSLQSWSNNSAPVDEEEMLIRLKYAAPQIGAMRGQEITNWSMALLLKIHVITGWVIPANQLMNILVDQFEKKLTEDYSMLNTEEIEYAFRSGGTQVKDWGKEMNLNLIDQVLTPYVSKRLLASANEEQKKSKPPVQKVYTDEEILNQRRLHIEQAFQAMKKGYYPILHRYFAEVLAADDLLKPNENIAEFFVRKLNSNAANIYIAK